MSLSGAVSLVAGVLGIAGLIGTALAVLITGRTKGTIQVLKDDNEALNGRVKTLETTEQACQKRLTAIEAQNAALTEVVTSAAKVDALADLVNVHHTEVLRRLEALGAT